MCNAILVHFATDESWTAMFAQIFDWNDFEVLGERRHKKICIHKKS